MSVEIDLTGSNIPGLPNKMEVKNAAEEATLKELLDLFKKTNKVEQDQLKALNKLAGIKEKKAKEDKPDPKKAAAEKKETESALRVAGANKQVASVSHRLGQSLGSMARSAGVVTRGVTVLGGSVIRAADQVAKLTIKASQLVGELAGIGDSITGATRSLSNIAVVGTFLARALGPAAEAAERAYSEYTKLAMSGANFGGSMQEMINAATGAGLTMEQFNNIVTQNGQAMMALGGTTEQGARRFAQMGKEMRQSQIGTELLRLGFTTQEVNSGMASYLNIVRVTGRMQNYSTAQLAEQSGTYMKNLQTLARITGQSVDEKKKESEQRMRDAQFLAATRNLTAGQVAEMDKIIGSYAQAHQAGVKDIIATGTATTEEARAFAVAFPQQFQLLKKAHIDMRTKGLVPTMQAQNQMRNSYANEAKAVKERLGTTVQYDERFRSVYQGATEAAAIQQDALLKAAAEEEKIAKEGGATAQQIADFKQKVAEVSNEMTKNLISTSALKAMETAFMGLANFTQQFVVPALRFMFDAIGYVVNIVGSVLSPVFATLGFVIDMITEGFKVLKPIIDIVVDVFSVIGKVLGSVLVPVIIGVGAAIAFAMAPVIVKIAAIVGIIGVLSKAFQGIKDTINWVAEKIRGAIDMISSPIKSGVKAVKGFFGFSSDESKERKQSADAIRKETAARKGSTEVDWSGPAALLKSYGEATGSVYAKNAAAEEKRLEQQSAFDKTMGGLSKEKQAQVEQELKSGKIQSEEAKKIAKAFPEQAKAMKESQKQLSTGKPTKDQSQAETQRLQRQATGKSTTQEANDFAKMYPEAAENLRNANKGEAEKPGFWSRVWDAMFGDSKKATDAVRKAEKAAAEEKIEYTINGRKATKEEYEAQRRGMDAWGKSLGLNLDSVSASQKSATDAIIARNAESKESSGMSAGTKGGLAGAGIGMMLGGPLGAAIGGFIGNRIAKVLEKKPKGEEDKDIAETLPEAMNSTTQALLTMRDKGFRPFTADLVKMRQDLSGNDIASGFESASSTIKKLFTNPFIARGGGAGGGGAAKSAKGGGAGGGGAGGGGAAKSAKGGGAGGGGAGGGGAGGDAGFKLAAISDKQGKPSPEDEATAGDLKEFLRTPSGADLDGLNDGTKKRLAALAKEYFNETGEKIQINTAFRSYEDQFALFAKYGSPRAARPGRSKHEVGLAFDMQSAHAAKAIQLGLFSKYGFHRPIASETWHVEPVEARGGVPDNPVAPGQEVMVANAGRPVSPDSGKPQAAKGGVLSGPQSGYDATLHGTEAVVPLPDGKTIPVSLEDTLINSISENQQSRRKMHDMFTNLFPGILQTAEDVHAAFNRQKYTDIPEVVQATLDRTFDYFLPTFMGFNAYTGYSAGPLKIGNKQMAIDAGLYDPLTGLIPEGDTKKGAKSYIDRMMDYVRYNLGEQVLEMMPSSGSGRIMQYTPQGLRELEKFADGGITRGPGIAGEAGPEAIVPLPDGRSIPVSLDGESQKAMVDLLSALNTKMDQLVYINGMLADIGNNQLKVQKNIGHPDLLMG